MEYKLIKMLVEYGIEKGLIEREDYIYTVNVYLEMLLLDSYIESDLEERIENSKDLERVLSALTDIAVTKGIIPEDSPVLRDNFDAKLMNVLMPKPSEIIKEFNNRYESDPREATNYYYNLSCASNYIRTNRVAKDVKWVSHTEYGDIDITINLSKPEKDPKMIAAARNIKSGSYPKCLLCMENEGYAGRINHPARHNHRIIPLTINNSKWGFQYSPYVYYNEHCIVFNGEHTPMKIDHNTFVKLFDFVKQFPHYFLGSNADLPIVGGSILSHDHFQGGKYDFAMAKAEIESPLYFTGYEDVEAGIVKWPMSVIRLSSDNPDRLISLSDKILEAWRGYTDKNVYIYAETNGEKHNTITPIVRMRNGKYEIDLVLRNNIVTKEHPMGLFHPWEEYHHLKKENIGLIEVMGLAVLPARLKTELDELKKAILNGEDIRNDESLLKHADWVDTIKGKYDIIGAGNIDSILKDEIAIAFMEILECAGVFKQTEAGIAAFKRFIENVNELDLLSQTA